MNPPATIRILHLEFDLRLVDDTFYNAAGAYGHCDNKTLVISVFKSIRPALLADTTIHEILHAIHFAVGCEDELKEEQIALQYSGPLCMVIRDNPVLMNWLNFLLRPSGCIPDDAPDV